MSRDLFKSEGPYKFEKAGHEEYRLSAPMPVGADGHYARECPDKTCSPGYFRVKGGTGLTGDDCQRAFCPYCRGEDDPQEFITRQQLDYMESIVTRQATKGLTEMLHETLGIKPGRPKRMGGSFLSIEMSVKSTPAPPVRVPFEEELRRDITCPLCGLEHHVFGLATWCPDCGRDIFLAHLKSELEVLSAMLNDVPRRREGLGERVAAKDLENILEDLVSVVEAVLKLVTRRKLSESLDPDEVDSRLKQIGNAYQSISRGSKVLREQIGLDLFDAPASATGATLEGTFEKRHPITHNLGIVDRKYLERAVAAEVEGREITVTEVELRSSIELVESALADVYGRAFSDSWRPEG